MTSTDGRVYLVDDDGAFLSALSRLLRLKGYDVLAFDSAPALLAAIGKDARGCVVADLDMPDVSGFELQQRLAASDCPLPVVFLTGRGDIPGSVQAMRSGAVDFLEKRAPQEDLLRAIGLALERDALESAQRLRRNEIRRRFALLTPRELEVLRIVVEGRMNKEIAAALLIGERTVKLHRTSISRKIGVHSAARLATLAKEAGLFG